MKKTVPIIFLLIYLLAVTELHQLSLLPVFFEHYEDHRLDNPTISLVDFIVIHYFSDDTTNDDYARDRQLPFKNDKCLEVSFSIAMPPEDLPETDIYGSDMTMSLVIFTSTFKAASFHLSIWQPPRA